MIENLTFREILSGHTNPRERANDTAAIKEYPHLMFSNIEHYHEALAVAQNLGSEALKTFNDNFAYLERMCARSNETAEVTPDCMEHSFYFRMFHEDGKMAMNGGIILHGLGGKSFSVELNPENTPHWSMHT